MPVNSTNDINGGTFSRGTPLKNSRRLWKWILFTAFLLTVPVPYFMIIVGGFVPAAGILYFAVSGLIVALPKFTAEGFWMLGILWAHVFILGGFLYGVASGITWFLFRIFPEKHARIVILFLVFVLFVVSTFEIYRVPGHNSAPPADIFRIYRGLLS